MIYKTLGGFFRKKIEYNNLIKPARLKENMESVLIYFPLVKEGYENLNLKELSNFLLDCNKGLHLVRENFPEVETRHSLADANYFGGGSRDAQKFLRYSIQFSGDEGSLQKATHSFIDICGIPYGVEKQFKILETYFENKGKKIKGIFPFLNFLDNRKVIVDNLITR